MNRGGVARLRAATKSAVDLFDWWRVELRDLAQWALRRLPSRRTPEVLLRVSDTGWTIERDGKSETLDESSGLTAELRGARAAIALPATEFFFDEIELPSAAERHLVTVLRLQLERRLPVPLDELLCDHRVLAHDKKRGVLRVRTAVAHRARVEQVRERALQLGLNPVSAGLLGEDGSLTFDLLRRRRDTVRWNPTPLDLRLLKFGGAAVVLLAAVIGAQWFFERSQIRDQVEELHAQADKLRATRDSLAAEAGPLLDLKALRQTGGAPDLLAKLSSSLPAPTWFTHVVLTVPAEGPATMRLTGDVASQDEVVVALKAIPGVRNVTSSAYEGAALGRERVEFRAEYAPVATEGASL